MKLFKVPYQNNYINLDNVISIFIDHHDRLTFQLCDGSSQMIQPYISPEEFDIFIEQFSPKAEFNKKLKEVVG